MDSGCQVMDHTFLRDGQYIFAYMKIVVEEENQYTYLNSTHKWLRVINNLPLTSSRY